MEIACLSCPRRTCEALVLFLFVAYLCVCIYVYPCVRARVCARVRACVYKCTTSVFDWCCFQYFIRNSLVSLLEALFALCIECVTRSYNAASQDRWLESRKGRVSKNMCENTYGYIRTRTHTCTQTHKHIQHISVLWHNKGGMADTEGRRLREEGTARLQHASRLASSACMSLTSHPALHPTQIPLFCSIFESPNCSIREIQTPYLVMKLSLCHPRKKERTAMQPHTLMHAHIIQISYVYMFVTHAHTHNTNISWWHRQISSIVVVVPDNLWIY